VSACHTGQRKSGRARHPSDVNASAHDSRQVDSAAPTSSRAAMKATKAWFSQRQAWHRHAGNRAQFTCKMRLLMHKLQRCRYRRIHTDTHYAALAPTILDQTRQTETADWCITAPAARCWQEVLLPSYAAARWAADGHALLLHEASKRKNNSKTTGSNPVHAVHCIPHHMPARHDVAACQADHTTYLWL
jgi:hypothetical protein